MNPTQVIMHCTDSAWGDRAEVQRWHWQRGFTSIGYHWLVLNGAVTYADAKNGVRIGDGLIEQGRPESESGAHCAGHNARSIGVCLVGTTAFSPAQMRSATRLVTEICQRYRIPSDSVLGHCETESGIEQGKTCPNLDMDSFRAAVAELLRMEASDG